MRYPWEVHFYVVPTQWKLGALAGDTSASCYADNRAGINHRSHDYISRVDDDGLNCPRTTYCVRARGRKLGKVGYILLRVV